MASSVELHLYRVCTVQLNRDIHNIIVVWTSLLKILLTIKWYIMLTNIIDICKYIYTNEPCRRYPSTWYVHLRHNDIIQYVQRVSRGHQCGARAAADLQHTGLGWLDYRSCSGATTANVRSWTATTYPRERGWQARELLFNYLPMFRWQGLSAS